MLKNDAQEFIMLKKMLLLSILVVITLSGCAPKNNNNDLYQSILKKDKLVVGISFDSRPFGFKDSDGQIKGLEADMARLIAERILGDKNKIIFKPVAFQDRINEVRSGDVDMVISAMTITPQRKKLVSFSDPYYVSGQVICVRKDSKIDSLYDLINKRVIVILGTTGEQNIKRFAPTALIEGYINDSEALDAFKSGSADAITDDDAFLQGLLTTEDGYIILPEKLTIEPYGIAFKKSRQTNLFIQKINEIINEIRYNGTLDNIKDKWGIS